MCHAVPRRLVALRQIHAGEAALLARVLRDLRRASRLSSAVAPDGVHKDVVLLQRPHLRRGRDRRVLRPECEFGGVGLARVDGDLRGADARGQDGGPFRRRELPAALPAREHPAGVRAGRGGLQAATGPPRRARAPPRPAGGELRGVLVQRGLLEVRGPGGFLAARCGRLDLGLEPQLHGGLGRGDAHLGAVHAVPVLAPLRPARDGGAVPGAQDAARLGFLLPRLRAGKLA
mmetsp:Transcript_87916/g.268988  ORF Transcript_87916/g.268988 Transcript_87916/m.268988 type:complete len:232 (-) Transcript_87916:553-1248(-)